VSNVPAPQRGYVAVTSDRTHLGRGVRVNGNSAPTLRTISGSDTIHSLRAIPCLIFREQPAVTMRFATRQASGKHTFLIRSGITSWTTDGENFSYAVLILHWQKDVKMNWLPPRILFILYRWDGGLVGCPAEVEGFAKV